MRDFNKWLDMDYKKKYNEALEYIKKVYILSTDLDEKSRIEEIFPELAESEGERMMKKIIATIHLYYGEPLEDEAKEMIAWIEMQGEHAKFRDSIQVGDKVTRNQDGVLVNLSQLNRVAKKDEKQGEQKPAEVEPKFKVGDWIIDIQDVVFNRIINSDGESYQIETCCSDFWLPIHITEKNYRLWTIQDAKDGDVLYSPCCKLLWIYKDDNSCYVGNNLSYNKNCVVVNSSICIPSDVCPATKEQRGLLSQKMHEAGYEWDAEKKELKKIEQKPILDVEIPFGAKDSELEEVTYGISKGYHAEIENNKVVIKKGEHKPAEWSKEDEMQLDAAIHLVSSTGHIETTNWLKVLKDRVLQQNITVTDEELDKAKKDAYNDALDKIEYHSGEPTFDDGWSAAIWYLKKKLREE